MRARGLWWSTYSVFLVAAIVVLPSLGPARQAGGGDPALRAELRGDDAKRPVFRPELRRRILFLLLAERDATRVFQQWCSWGYFTRSFSAEILGGAAGRFAIKRNPNRVWSKNYPASHRLDRGELLITSVDLCDGTWIAEPALPQRDLELVLTGHFAIAPDEHTAEQRVWTGRIDTAPLRIIVGRGCTEVLNRHR